MLATRDDGSWSRLSSTKILPLSPVNKAPFLLSSAGWVSSHYIVPKPRRLAVFSSATRKTSSCPLLHVTSRTRTTAANKVQQNTAVWRSFSPHSICIKGYLSSGINWTLLNRSPRCPRVRACVLYVLRIGSRYVSLCLSSLVRQIWSRAVLIKQVKHIWHFISNVETSAQWLRV
jgi:hypothetical protein